MTPEFVTFANIFIDDIVLPSGQTFMGTLGGAGTHALVGMRVWSDRLGFVAAVGTDFDPACRAQLTKLGVDLTGVIERTGPRTTRAWQLFEPDDRRTEIFRIEISEFEQFTIGFDDIPVSYYQAKGYHIYWGGALKDLPDFVARLRAVNHTAILVWEPAAHHEQGDPREIQAALPLFDLFSPDHAAAQAMSRTSSPDSAMNGFLDWGAKAVAIRMGAAGSIVRTADGSGWRVPAIPTRVVDVTGAGNAYCGGFTVALGKGYETGESALHAAVSASFAIEQFGIPDSTAGLVTAVERLDWARSHVSEYP